MAREGNRRGILQIKRKNFESPPLLTADLNTAQNHGKIEKNCGLKTMRKLEGVRKWGTLSSRQFGHSCHRFKHTVYQKYSIIFIINCKKNSDKTEYSQFKCCPHLIIVSLNLNYYFSILNR